MKNILLTLLLVCAAFTANTQCIEIADCPSLEQFCDYTDNHADLWNESYWFDNVNQTQDLSETEIDLASTAVVTCPGTALSAKYLLFLDLDGDNIRETVIKSWELPAPGTVNYNNYLNPNFEGGESRVFDQRPVPADQKYQFALETTASGDTLTARLRWNTQSAPNTFVNTLLPYGNHRIEWVFSNNLGNENTCAYNVFAKDCMNPTVVCLNGLTVNIMPTGEITLWAADFLQYGQDNATPTSQLEYSIRKKGTGTGFPLDANGNPYPNVIFDCAELGTQLVELWVRDRSGNTNFCETYVVVQDNLEACDNLGGPNAPVVICTNGVSVSLVTGGTAEVNASQLLNNVFDDNTPTNLIDISMRKCATGTGFPLDGQGNPVQTLVYGDTELGTQCIELWARDAEGNASYCETYVVIQNNGSSSIAPTLVCLNGLSVNIMPTGVVQLFATDFLQYVEDDNTPTAQIELGLRKNGTGSGFPEDSQGNPITSVEFNCNELGQVVIELWARDLDGNTAYCETYALVQDNMGNCQTNLLTDLTLCVNRWCDNAVVSGLNLEVSGTSSFAPPFSYFIDQAAELGADGCWHFGSQIPVSSTFFIAPSLDVNPLNGVTPLDLVKISKHILGLEPLQSYALIAADINKSGSITTFDIVEGRKLITGVYQEYPNNTSWRFVDAAFNFPNQNNPFQTAFPEEIALSSLQDTTVALSFIAIKVGDVDCDATPGAIASPDDRSVAYLHLPDAVLQAGETVEIPVTFSEAGEWLALATGLVFNPEQLAIELITPGNLPGLDRSMFVSPKSGEVNMLWFNTTAYAAQQNEKLYTLHLRALAPVRLSEAISFSQPTTEHPRAMRSEGYNQLETPFTFQPAFRGEASADQSKLNQVYAIQPNPTAGFAQIPVRLSQTETVELQLTDLSGKVLLQTVQSLPSGMHLLDIPAEAMPQAGVYAWRVRAGMEVATGKLVRL